MPLADILPRLLASELAFLPPRLQAREEAAEASLLAAERSRFSAGAELAARLDERAAKFLDPALVDAARGPELESADKRVREAGGKLETARNAGTGIAEPAPRASALWEGHGRGELLDMPSPSLAAAAKAKGLDLLVHGKVEEVEGFALVRISGYDPALDRAVFSWKGFCSPEDPAPLALEIARKIERWVAGRDFARLDIEVEPRSSIVLLDGKRLAGDELAAYRFEPCDALVEADAPGYAAAAVEEELLLGQRKTVSLKLEPTLAGSAEVTADAEGASILVDSVYVGKAPLTLQLSGKREIVTAYAPGRERAIAVMPSAGEPAIALELKPDDALGPGGRVAAAKDRFYKAFAWFACSLPVASLAVGSSSIYSEAATRSGDGSLTAAYAATGILAGAAIAASAGFAVNSVIHLVRYLRTAR